VADRQDDLGPSPHDAEPAFARGLAELTAVRRLRAALAAVLTKAEAPEFALVDCGLD